MREIRLQIEAPGFRQDINALRAVAFVSVLLYHFRVPGFHGGFAGVDVFLVISGYLMMSIISRQTAKRRFSFLDFYSRRLSRLTAPLVFVVPATFLAGWLTLVPSALESLGRHSISALTYTSNILFWRESGYFDSESALKFLLHTWSLSLEMQFYIVFPIIYLLGRRITKRWNSGIFLVAIFAVASFLLSVVATEFKPVPSFFLLPTRLWEFLVGALAFEFARNLRVRKLGGLALWSGLGLIAFTVFWLDASSVWPGWLAAIPVAGTALVILANAQDNWLLTLKPVQALGLISYSGYLWHWPILVLLVISGNAGDPMSRAAGIFVALVLGTLSWMFAERRVAGWLQRQAISARVAALFALVAAASIVPVGSLVTSGFPGRLSPELNEFLATAEARPRQKHCVDAQDTHCLVQGTAEVLKLGTESIGAVLVGDSHAAMIAQTIAEALPAHQSQVAMLAVPACATIRGIHVMLDFSGACAASVDAIFSLRNLDSTVPVIVANRYSYYTIGANETPRGRRPNYHFGVPYASWSDSYTDAVKQGYQNTFCEMARTRRLIIVLPFPEFPASVPMQIGSKLVATGAFQDSAFDLNDYEMRNEVILPILHHVANECGATLVDPTTALCPSGQCRGTHRGRILYTDSNHLSESGADLFYRIASEVMAIASVSERPNGEPGLESVQDLR